MASRNSWKEAKVGIVVNFVARKLSRLVSHWAWNKEKLCIAGRSNVGVGGTRSDNGPMLEGLVLWGVQARQEARRQSREWQCQSWCSTSIGSWSKEEGKKCERTGGAIGSNRANPQLRWDAGGGSHWERSSCGSRYMREKEMSLIPCEGKLGFLPKRP